jgi:peptidoglycan/xylan/chitin deacetylase (PgdA/CDA1 family)
VKLQRNHRPLILCYHRISEVKSSDKNRLCVDPDNFRSQLNHLRKTRTFVALEELVTLYEPNSVAVTFDDGYKDNIKIAANILTDLNIPSSFFLATRFIEHSVNFYTTSLNALRELSIDKRNSLVASFGSHLDRFLGDSFNYQDALFQLSSESPSSLWELSKELDSIYRSLFAGENLDEPLSIRDVKQISSSSLFSIGPHTATHPRISSISTLEAIDDFQESLIKTHEWGGSSNMYFPFPFGQKSDLSAVVSNEILQRESIRSMSTLPMSISKLNWKNEEMMLPRLSVQNWTLERFSTLILAMEFFSYVPIAMHAGLHISKRLRIDASSQPTNETVAFQ